MSVSRVIDRATLPPLPDGIPAWLADDSRRWAAYRAFDRFVEKEKIDDPLLIEMRVPGAREVHLTGQNAVGEKFGIGYDWTAEDEAKASTAMVRAMFAAHRAKMEREDRRAIWIFVALLAVAIAAVVGAQIYG